MENLAYGYKTGLEDGYQLAMTRVAAIVTELTKAGNHEWAQEIHDMVWSPLRDQRAAAVKDQYAAIYPAPAADLAQVLAALAADEATK